MKPSHRRMYIFNWNNFWHGSNKNKSWAKGELGMKQELKSQEFKSQKNAIFEFIPQNYFLEKKNKC